LQQLRQFIKIYKLLTKGKRAELILHLNSLNKSLKLKKCNFILWFPSKFKNKKYYNIKGC